MFGKSILLVCIVLTLVFCSLNGASQASETFSSHPEKPDETQGYSPFYLPIVMIPCVSKCFYIDSINGSDSNPGNSRSQPWKTIQKAADSMAPGDTAIVLAASANERVNVNRSGIPGAPITFQAEGIILMEGFTVNANYISIFGFEITNTPEWGIFVEGSYCDIEGNYIHFAKRGGIKVYSHLGREEGTSNCTVRANRLYRNVLTGIEVYGRNNLIEGNEIWGTIQYPPGYQDADGIRFFGSGHVIRGNYIHDISYDDPENIDPHIDCFQTWAGSDHEVGHDIVFEKNICVNLEAQSPYENGQGFMIQGANHITIRNNIIRAFRIINSYDNSYIRIENNTFTNDLSLPYNYHPYMVNLYNSQYIVVKNNIMYDPEAAVVYADERSKQGLEVGYNIVYRSDGRIPLGNPYPNDLWQINPQFVNPGAFDYHLLRYSPAINAGISLDSVVDDFDGFPRPLGSGFDIGAYEYPYSININPPIVHINDTLNITLTFATNGQPITITSTLPAQLDYLSSSASCPATVTYSDISRTVTLSGAPPPASDCNLRIDTTVNTNKKMLVIVSATIDNGLTMPQIISRTICLNGLPYYFPCIRKNR